MQEATSLFIKMYQIQVKVILFTCVFIHFINICSSTMRPRITKCVTAMVHKFS